MKICSMFLSPRTFFLFVCLHIQFLSLITLSSAAVRVGSEATYFTHPISSNSDPSSEESLSYELGSIQKISWVTDLDVFNISIWQRGDDGGSSTRSSSGGIIFAKIEESDPVTTTSWVVQTYSFDLDTSSVFYLAIEGDESSEEYTSAEFNITSSSSSTSSSKNSTIPSSTDTSTNSSRDSESDDSSSPATTSSSTALTSTGKIALGLGVGIGAPLISLLAILAYFQYRTIRRQNHMHPDLHPHPHPHHHGHGHTDSIPYPQTTHGHYSHHPSMTGVGGGGGGFYPSPSPIDQQQQHHHLQIPLPPSILPPSPIPTNGPLYRTANTEPSELPQKLAKPVHLPPWEVHSESVTPPSSTSLDGLGVLPASDSESSRRLSGRRRDSRNQNQSRDGNRDQNQDRERSRTRISRIGRAITTAHGPVPAPPPKNTYAALSASRSRSLWEGRGRERDESRGEGLSRGFSFSRRGVPVMRVESKEPGPGPDIPELHGDSANFI